MYLKNNNSALVTKLCMRNLKSNTLRNLFAILAIALTATMFTSLFTVGVSMNKSIQEEGFKMVGGYAHCTLKDTNEELYEEVLKQEDINKVGYSIAFGILENKELKNRNTELRYTTLSNAEMSYSVPTTGHLPEKENEIALDTKALNLLGVEANLGEEVTVQFLNNSEVESRTFTLCGFWTFSKAFPVSMAYVSKATAESLNTDFHQLDINVLFNSSRNVDRSFMNLINDLGKSLDKTSPDFIDSGINWMYQKQGHGGNYEMLIGIFLICFIIGITGYLMIFNVFHISIVRDIKFYGLLKTIGTTPKQIKGIIYRQALLLSLLSIPLGLLFGYILGARLLPYIMNTTTVNTMVISNSPIIYTLASLFCIMTVLISCRKPGKIASTISPIEGVKYSQNVSIHKKGSSRKNNKLSRFAYMNLKRNSKRTILIITSLSLGLILYNQMGIFTESLSMDKYMSRFTTSDFLIAREGYFTNRRIDLKPLSESTQDKLDNFIATHTTIEGGHFYTYDSNPEVTVTSSIPMTDLYGADDFILNTLEVVDGEVDIDQLKSGQYIIEYLRVDDFNEPKPDRNLTAVGDKVTLSNSLGEMMEYTVLAKVKIKRDYHNRSYSIEDGTSFLLPTAAYKEITKQTAPLLYSFNGNMDLEVMKGEVENFLEQHSNLTYESKLHFKDQFQGTINMFKLVGNLASGFMALIGLLNLTNTMMTSLISRKVEFAMLESMGMTKAQLKKMLAFEGLYYAGFTTLFSILGSILISLIISNTLGKVLWILDYTFTLNPLFTLLPLIFIFAISLPLIIYPLINRNSIIDNLRQVN